MSITQLTAVLESAVMLILLATLFIRLLPSYRLDSFRQEMFGLRDELFDYAASGQIGFDDPAYRLLRQSMNGYIRYAHRITFFRLCVGMLGRPSAPPQPWHEKWEVALTNVKSSEVKNRLLEFHFRSGLLMMGRLITGSPLLIALFAMTFVGLLLRDGWKNLKRVGERAAEFAVSRVVNPRLVEEDAAACAVA